MSLYWEDEVVYDDPNVAKVRKQLQRIANRGSLLTWEGTDTCLGYLMDFDGRGVYEPNAGKVDVTSEEAARHNAALDKSLLDGLDNNCEVGQRGTFYFHREDGKALVKTWCGALVSDHVLVRGTSVTFRRAGKVYRGRLQKHAECFNFRRIS